MKSKHIILIMTIFLIAVFWLKISEQKPLTNIPAQQTTTNKYYQTHNEKNPYYELITKNGDNTYCVYEDCLFQDNKSLYTFGLASLQGFYGTTTRWGMGDVQVQCASLTITGGNEKLIKSYLEIISSGNAVNIKNDKEQVIINIDLKNLDEATKQKITGSNEEEPVSINVFAIPPAGRGANDCHSVVKILEVK